MRKKELASFREKDTEKLHKEAEGKKFEIIKTLSEAKASKEKNLKKVKFLRRDLAQILTLIREKEIQESEKTKSGKEETK